MAGSEKWCTIITLVTKSSLLTMVAATARGNGLKNSQGKHHIKAIKFQAQLWQIGRIERRFWAHLRTSGYYHGCRFAGQSWWNPELYKMITDGLRYCFGMEKRKDLIPSIKTIPTKIYNGVTRWMTGIHLHDMNYSLKAYRSDVVKVSKYMVRCIDTFLSLPKWAGFHKVGKGGATPGP